MSCGVGLRPSLDLWLWPTAVALTQPLAWEPPYASGDLKKKKKKKKKSKVWVWTLLSEQKNLKQEVTSSNLSSDKIFQRMCGQWTTKWKADFS